MTDVSDPGQWFAAAPQWFKTAVFYEIHLRGFNDGNGDGSGDFRGLIEKLDYLQWLGIDCIWLLPMYKSPLRDGGYDVASYEEIHPDYGSIEDVREFIEAARATGVPGWRIVLRHIVPNLLGVVAVYATLLVPLMILTESFMSFLGLGVQEPLTSWGALISEGADTMAYGTLWQLAFPLFFFVVTLFAFFFVGDGLRDALDPRDR